MNAHLTQALYFVAVMPEAALQQKVTELKQYMAETYGAAHALKSPPHITLIPPFRYPEQQQAGLTGLLDIFSADRTPFNLTIDGFDDFPPRVIFLKVQPSQPLGELQEALHQIFMRNAITEERRQERPFHAHMTIAFKDLRKPAFYRAKKALQGRKFEFTFTVHTLFLLKHDGKRWTVVHASPLKQAGPVQ